MTQVTINEEIDKNIVKTLHNIISGDVTVNKLLDAIKRLVHGQFHGKGCIFLQVKLA